MAMIRWNPWAIDRLLSEDWELPTIPGLSRLAGQGINLYETEDSIVAELAVPGVPEDRIDVTMDDGVVRVSGSYEEKQEERKKRRYYMSSMGTSFNYSFRIPQGVVESEEPMVNLDNGVVRIRFKKVKKQEPRRIRITAGQRSEDERLGRSRNGG